MGGRATVTTLVLGAASAAGVGVLLSAGSIAVEYLGWPLEASWIGWLWGGLLDVHVREELVVAGWWRWLALSAAVAVLSSLAAGVLSFWALMRLRHPSGLLPDGGRQLRGRGISASARSAEREFANECRRSGEVARLHPSVPLSDERSRRGVFVLGSPGGGKTQIIDHLIGSLLAQNSSARVIVYDNKLDYTEKLARRPGTFLFAPWDRRGLAWHVAADVTTRAQARDLAARLVPAVEGENAVFSEGARLILTGLIIHLQRKRGKAWTFRDLARAATAPYASLREVVCTAYPPASTILPPEMTRTTQSMVANLGVYLADVHDLGDAWSPRHAGERIRHFSFRRWLLEPDSPEARRGRCLVLQGHRSYPQLSRGYIQAVLGAVGGLLTELTDSRTRALWLVLDELPQLGRIPDLMTFLETGRSKGIRPVLAAQDLAQLRAIYGPDAVGALEAMIGTYVVCRSQGHETPEWVSRLIGERTVERRTHSINRGAGSWAGERFQGSTESSYRNTEPVLSPDEVTSGLGPRASGVQALLVPGGDTVYRLTWPYIDLADSLGVERAPASEAARWTLAARARRTKQPPRSAADQHLDVPEPEIEQTRDAPVAATADPLDGQLEKLAARLDRRTSVPSPKAQSEHP